MKEVKSQVSPMNPGNGTLPVVITSKQGMPIVWYYSEMESSKAQVGLPGII
jgi:hypothetical protein